MKKDLISKLYSAASKKLWIKKAVKYPGAFKKALLDVGYITPGQPIPYRVKQLGCSDPRKMYYEIFGHIPHRKSASKFQKQSCLALRFHKFSTKKKKSKRAA